MPQRINVEKHIVGGMFSRKRRGSRKKMLLSHARTTYEKPFFPSPRLRGEGAGGEGLNRLETLPALGVSEMRII
jgi:hypothetical protein